MDGFGQAAKTRTTDDGDLGTSQLSRHVLLEELSSLGGALVYGAWSSNDVIGGHGGERFGGVGGVELKGDLWKSKCGSTYQLWVASSLAWALVSF